MDDDLKAAVKRRDEARRTYREMVDQRKAAKAEADKAQADLDDLLSDQASGQGRMFTGDAVPLDKAIARPTRR